MTRTLVDCGCTARVHSDGSGIEIDYCPMHEVALDLLVAAKQAISVWPDQMRGSTLEAAVLKAEGKWTDV